MNAQDYGYINEISKIIGQYQTHINYYPRVIDSMFLPVYVTQRA